MSIFDRLKDITEANLNSWIDKMEDPEKMLNQYIREAQDQVAEIRQAVVKERAAANRLKTERDNNASASSDYERKAKVALQNNDEDMARKLLGEKQKFDSRVSELDTSFQQADTQATNLDNQLKKLEEKIDMMKRERDSLVLRNQAAEAQKKVNSVMSGIGSDSISDKFDRMKDKVAQNEAEAQAGQDLATSRASVADEFEEKYGSHSSSVDDELAKLKASMNQGE